ncbi:MAG TPA: DCL family protein [Kiritimatiellia bacterium]|nr:DCL family protein [Kiritimatiellia bacterium]HMP35031.1 DCL family protein [Kiritimatiellia bacterium]
MGKRIEVKVGDLSFRTKKEAKEYFGAILRRHEAGDMLVGKDYQEIEALLMNHPRARDKIGPGIEAIVVEIEPHHGSKCFFVYRTDGTRDDFGYGHCIDDDRSPFATFSDAARKVVRPYMSECKSECFEGRVENKVVCEATGKELAWDEAVVDHEPPLTFSVIVNAYVKERGIDLNAVEYIRDIPGGVEFGNKALAQDFDCYHQQRAKLRVIDRGENLRTAYKGRLKLGKQGTTNSVI